MPQEEFLTSMEEEYSQTEMEITVCVAEGGHTSVPGPGRGRKEHFGSIGDMIVHWQGMESKEDEEKVEEETFGGGGGGRD